MQMDQTGRINVGVNQRGVRDHNERLLLSMIRRARAAPGSELAKKAGLSAQTVSVILRSLERDELIKKGDPRRGKVGKPSVPMMLNADGAFSFGIKIGRRSADLVLMDLHGNVRGKLQTHYPFPMPETVFGFLREGISALVSTLPHDHVERVFGIAIALPFEIWRWHEAIGAPAEKFRAWEGLDISEEIAKFSNLAVWIINDATAACYAENVFGQGQEVRDYAYFFIGSFIGGGITLNHTVFEGNLGNAGALGSLQSRDAQGRNVQLIDTASLHILEREIADSGGDPMILSRPDDDWSGVSAQLDPWIDRCSVEIARAALSACAVIDFGAVIIDGAFPASVRARLVEQIRAEIGTLDTRGLIRPSILEGQVGENARVVGAAYVPISSRHFLNSDLGVAV